MPDASSYELFYWPSIQGRGEFVRLAFEEAGAPYVDVCRLPEEQGGGVAALLRILKDEALATPALAPPILRVGELLVAQTASILQFLAPRLELVAVQESARIFAGQLQLTLGDFVNEIHDTHHPLAVGWYYEQQKSEASRRAAFFVSERLPKFLSYFERVLRQNSQSAGRHLVGSQLSYTDLSMFQVLVGLEYAFPNAMKRQHSEIPLLLALRDSVAQRPRVSTYLASERRLPFNQQGIFRHYRELDGGSDAP